MTNETQEETNEGKKLVSASLRLFEEDMEFAKQEARRISYLEERDVNYVEVIRTLIEEAIAARKSSDPENLVRHDGTNESIYDGQLDFGYGSTSNITWSDLSISNVGTGLYSTPSANLCVSGKAIVQDLVVTGNIYFKNADAAIYYPKAFKIESEGESEYRNAVASGVDIRKSVVAATTEHLEVERLGNSLVDFSGNRLFVVDDIIMSDGDRILVKDQRNAEENGIYVFCARSANGGPGWYLARSADADSDKKVFLGMCAYVQGGLINRKKTFILTTDGNIDLNETPLKFEQFSGK